MKAVYKGRPADVWEISQTNERPAWVKAAFEENYPWIIHLGIWDMKSHLAGLKATFGALRILTEQRSW